MASSPTTAATWRLGIRFASAPNALLRPRREQDVFGCFVTIQPRLLGAVRSEGGEMGALKTFLVAATSLLFSGPLNAQADLVWDWTGDCNGIVSGPC